jgi:hypothetical protein
VAIQQPQGARRLLDRLQHLAHPLDRDDDVELLEHPLSDVTSPSAPCRAWRAGSFDFLASLGKRSGIGIANPFVLNTDSNHRRFGHPFESLSGEWSGPLGADRDQAAGLTVCRARCFSNCWGLR